MRRESKRDPNADEPQELSLQVLAETDKAILVYDGVKVREWLPKSQIDNQDWEIGKVYTIIVPFWLAMEKGLV